jgi:excisionase family DNA binding protein
LKLVTREDAAQQIKKHPRTVSRLIKDGLLPAFRIGGTVRIAQTDLDNYIESQRIPVVAPSKNDGLKALVARAVAKARERRAS